jgi:hypothetical protein
MRNPMWLTWRRLSPVILCPFRSDGLHTEGIKFTVSTTAPEELQLSRQIGGLILIRISYNLTIQYGLFDDPANCTPCYVHLIIMWLDSIRSYVISTLSNHHVFSFSGVTSRARIWPGARESPCVDHHGIGWKSVCVEKARSRTSSSKPGV